MLYMHARPDTHIANTILNQPEQNGLVCVGACVLERASVCVYEMWLYAHTHITCDVMLFVRFGMYVSGWLARWRLLAGERACVSTHLEQNIYIYISVHIFRFVYKKARVE